MIRAQDISRATDPEQLSRFIKQATINDFLKLNLEQAIILYSNLALAYEIPPTDTEWKFQAVEWTLKNLKIQLKEKEVIFC